MHLKHTLTNVFFSQANVLTSLWRVPHC